MNASSWKHSTVYPIPKTSPPSSSPSEYHPISLLSIVSKLLEKHIFHIVIDHLYSNQLIPPNQFGFLPCRSTTRCSNHCKSFHLLIHRLFLISVVSSWTSRKHLVLSVILYYSINSIPSVFLHISPSGFILISQVAPNQSKLAQKNPFHLQ